MCLFTNEYSHGSRNLFCMRQKSSESTIRIYNPYPQPIYQKATQTTQSKWKWERTKTAGVSLDYYCPFSLFTNMSGLIQRCISWTVSLFCILVLGNIIYELHVFSQENLGNHSDMAIRQNRNSESSEMFEMKQTDGSDEWDKFANFGKFERNRIFFLLYYNKQSMTMTISSILFHLTSWFPISQRDMRIMGSQSSLHHTLSPVTFLDFKIKSRMCWWSPELRMIKHLHPSIAYILWY